MEQKMRFGLVGSSENFPIHESKVQHDSQMSLLKLLLNGALVLIYYLKKNLSLVF